jgi:hypothetical protein
MKDLSCARHTSNLIGGALLSMAIFSHVSAVSAEEAQTDSQALARRLLDPAATASFAGAGSSRSQGHRDPQYQAQCMILAARCEIAAGANATLTDVSSSPDVRQRDLRIDAADLARQMILGQRAWASPEKPDRFRLAHQRRNRSAQLDIGVSMPPASLLP